MANVLKKFFNDFKDINKYYNFLIKKTKEIECVLSINELLITNFDLLSKYKIDILKNKKIISKRLSLIQKNYFFLKQIVVDNNYRISLETLINELNKYQKENRKNFSYKEIENIKEILIFIYMDKLSSLYKDEYVKLSIKQNITRIIKDINTNKAEAKLDDFIKSGFVVEENYYYIFELNSQLEKLEVNIHGLFRDLNTLLEQKQISLRELINDEDKRQIENNILISNIFDSLKELVIFDYEYLLCNISTTEKLFLEDDFYKKMTLDSKKIYRKQLEKLSRKKHCQEIDCLKKIFEESKSEKKYIGTYLLNNKNQTFSCLICRLLIVLVSLIGTYFLSNYFVSSRLLGFIILFIPINQLTRLIFSQSFNYYKSKKVLLKLDYSKGIPRDSRTMVVIPSAISSCDEVKEIFDRLETFYLMNKTNNLYFTLLGDVFSSDKTECVSSDIFEYSVNYASNLNKKYNKDLFYFVCHKRSLNKKRGILSNYGIRNNTLVNFNKFLLNTLNDDYFNVNTIENKKLDIKYVVTLSTNTKLDLNCIQNLVGTMAHPLNRPVFNKNKTKLISGSFLMMPKVSLDIEVVGKNIYNRIFFQLYDFNLEFNVYNNLCFNDKFIGRVIYDLDVFNQVMNFNFSSKNIISRDSLLVSSHYVDDARISNLSIPVFFESAIYCYEISVKNIKCFCSTLKMIFDKKSNKVNLNYLFLMFYNIVGMFFYPMLLLVLLISILLKDVSLLYWILFVVLVFLLPSVFKFNKYKKNYNENLCSKTINLLFSLYLRFCLIPFYTFVYLYAFFTAIYELLSHRKLHNKLFSIDLNSNKLFNYIKIFIPNIFLFLVITIISFIMNNYNILVLSVMFLSVVVILFLISLSDGYDKVLLNDKKNQELREVCYRTWRAIYENLCSEYNYLIPHSYCEDGNVDLTTNPTSIGYLLTSVISAYELDFITMNEAVDLLRNILNSVDSLEKWHGHLYGLYDIKTKEVVGSRFVVTTDSANFVAALIVVREFLNTLSEEKLVKLCDKLIKNTDFKKLYTKNGVFSIGYDGEEREVSTNTKNLIEESILTSYLAICLGKVSSNHWSYLDGTYTFDKRNRNTNISMEELGAFLFIKNYPDTFINQIYQNSFSEQKNYIKDNKCFFGSMNISKDVDRKIILEPYISLVMMKLYPKSVYRNMVKMKKMGMFSKYGFYEAYDYNNKEIIKTFNSTHQGMILTGLTNYLKKDVIKEYFFENILVSSFSDLLKDNSLLKCNNHNSGFYNIGNINKDDKIINSIKDFDTIPEVFVLSNKKYSLIMNQLGNSVSKYQTLQLNRYREVTKQDYGQFLYIKDLDTNYIWSNTYAPVNKIPDKYEVKFDSDKITFLRCDRDVFCKTEVIVTKNHCAEIRKITFKNQSDSVKNLEITSYMEPILSDDVSDFSHKVFNSMFISSFYDSDTNSLIVKRNSHKDDNVTHYMFNRLLISNPMEEFSYETERSNFIGRNHFISNPLGMGCKFRNYSGDNLDPIMSLRNTIKIKPNSSQVVYLISGYGRNREQINDIINSYSAEKEIEQAFKVCGLISKMDIEYSYNNVLLYNTMLKYLYQTKDSLIDNKRRMFLQRNSLGQSELWKFGISGDLPIILVEINSINNINFIIELLKAFNYYKNNLVFIDMVIINNESDNKIIKKYIDEEIYRMSVLSSFYHNFGDVIVINGDDINKDDRNLLYMVSRLNFVASSKKLKDVIEQIKVDSKTSNYLSYSMDDVVVNPKKEELVFDNGYGGFKNNGCEYVIYRSDTPMPWSNIIANDKFGTVITNNGCGFTYAYNSSFFKLTSWTNEMIVNDKSEGFKFNGRIFEPIKCTHGFGYSILENETNELKEEVTEFVAKDDTVKIYLVKLVNKLDKKVDIDVSFWTTPVLGNFIEKTSRYILTDFMGEDNYLRMRNVYSNNFFDISVFMSSSLKISSVDSDSFLVKSINGKIILDKLEEKTLVFVLGCGHSDDENVELVKKYTDLATVKKELGRVVSNWRNILGTIEVESPDISFNYMMNGWYLYQTVSSRILSKSGFYQVSGVCTYSEMLQDAMNLVIINSDFVREQILISAKHQFVEGDVLHWWDEDNMFGLRSRYNDDSLWLIYALTNYVEVTQDLSILDEMVPYAMGDILSNYEYERCLIYRYSDYSETLLEHCIKSLKLLMNSLGKRKIPLMGTGDFNEEMNRVGIKGKGESVSLGFFLYQVIDKFVFMIQKYDLVCNVDEYVLFNERLKDILNKEAWDGKYYLRGFFDNGDKLGSCENSECSIDLLVQSLSILSGIVSDDLVDLVINSVEEQLVDNDRKIIKLLSPSFSKSLNNPGSIMNYHGGIKKNGGHCNSFVYWYLLSLLKTGYYEKAYKYYQIINPINRSLSDGAVKSYKVEPYVIADDIYSSEEYSGCGGWTWYSQSSSQFYNIGIKDILGLRREGTKIILVPNIPDEWKSYKIIYHYMDTIYDIEVIRNKKEQLELDDKKQNSNSFELVNDKRKHKVILYIK